MEVIFHLYRNLGDMLSFSPASFFKQMLMLPYNTENCKKANKNSAAAIVYRSHSHVARLQEIPKEIIEYILESRLLVSDRIRLSAVSRYSQTVSMQKSIQAAPQIPWLVLPQDPNRKGYLSALELLPPQHQGRLLKLKLPKQLQGALVCGSSKGWLVLAKAVMPPVPVFLSSRSFGFRVAIELFLFNPISRSTLQLPPLFKSRSLLKTLKNLIGNLPTIVLSSSNPSNCIVASLHWDGGTNHLQFCRTGDKQWSKFFQDGKDDDVRYADILFYNGTLYAFTFKGVQVVEDFTCKTKAGDEVRLKIIPNLSIPEPLLEVDYPFDDAEFGICREVVTTLSLLESTSGELLLISRTCDILTTKVEEDNDFDYIRTTGFKVFKLNPNTGEICILHNLGHQVIFVAASGSLSISTKDLGGFQENCIFFVEEWTYLYEKFRPLVSRESGVYYLDNERIERCFPSVKLPMNSSMSWYIPTL